VLHNIATFVPGLYTTYEREHAAFELSLANLRLCSTIPFIYLKMTKFHSSLWLSIVYKYLIFLIYLSVVGHLGCFHSLAIVSSAAINMGTRKIN
jgi:hypothetical protein